MKTGSYFRNKENRFCEKLEKNISLHLNITKVVDNKSF